MCVPRPELTSHHGSLRPLRRPPFREIAGWPKRLADDLRINHGGASFLCAVNYGITCPLLLLQPRCCRLRRSSLAMMQLGVVTVICTTLYIHAWAAPEGGAPTQKADAAVPCSCPHVQFGKLWTASVMRKHISDKTVN